MPLFGTDGVRGLANGPLTADLALTLAQATAVVLGQGRSADARRAAGKRLTAVVARDPRVSGEFLSAAVAAGLAASGVDVLDAGVIPTPAAAFLVGSIDADFGVSKASPHQEAALELVNWMGTAEFAQLYVDHLKQISPVKGVEPTDPVLKEMVKDWSDDVGQTACQK